ncbi:MAG: methylated-DNA--[protein]-cysteine S-methyltransferase [Pontiella sp.]
MTDYERIAKVIRYMDGHREEQPDLTTLAKHVGLSPSHFHRLFSVWAGITPKDFLQCLTLSHAKKLLKEGDSVLDAALGSGLSEPGRLHGLCVNLEAATPGDVKTGGEGWTILAGYAEAPFGTCLIAESPRGLCHLSFVQSKENKATWSELQAHWPKATLERDDTLALNLSTQIFDRNVCSNAPLKAYVKGTAFQVRVWQGLLQVPQNTLVSYGQLASLVGNSAAVRAVGTAVRRNKLAYLIPCHRVIRETGVIGGYRWGETRKKAIHAWESSGIFIDFDSSNH